MNYETVPRDLKQALDDFIADIYLTIRFTMSYDFHKHIQFCILIFMLKTELFENRHYFQSRRVIMSIWSSFLAPGFSVYVHSNNRCQ